MSKEEELGIGKAGRKVDMKEEYYVSVCALFCDGLGFVVESGELDGEWKGDGHWDVDGDLETVLMCKFRGSRRRIWMIGNRSVLRDFLENMMV